MKQKILDRIRNILGISEIENRIESLESLLLHKDSKLNGFSVLKRHLNRPDKPLPCYMGEEIKQD